MLIGYARVSTCDHKPRLARSTRQRLGTGETLERRGIGLKILSQNMDTTCVDGHLIFTAFSTIAEFEHEIIRERTRAALDAARPGGSTYPCAVSAKDLKEARALLTNPEMAVVSLGRRLGVGPSARYRDLPAARHSAQGIEG